MIDIETIKSRAEAATPAPWIIDVDEQTVRATKISGKKILFDKSAAVWSEDNNSNDANFIANAREDIPALIAEVESLRKAYDSLDNSHHYLFTAFNKATAEVERLQSELDRATAERDAAVVDLNSCKINRARFCKNFDQCFKECSLVGEMMPCANCEKWQWRGERSE